MTAERTPTLTIRTDSLVAGLDHSASRRALVLPALPVLIPLASKRATMGHTASRALERTSVAAGLAVTFPIVSGVLVAFAA